MASITRKQYELWNSKAANGFEFDLHNYVVWNEKRLRKEIKQDNGNILVYILHNAEVREAHKTIGYEVEAIKEILTPTKTDSVYTVTEKERLKTGIITTRRDYNALCKCSAAFCEF